MGQGVSRLPEASAVGGDAAGGREPIGRYIAQQRRLRGIELEDLAARTRIPRRSLERLEAGAFDHSPDGFSRGFVRTVAEAIGLDPDAAVARMLPEPDTSRRSAPRRGRALAVIAAAVALAGIALAVRELASSRPARPQGTAAGELPVRRDYVRALAEAQGVATARLTARDAMLAPLPPLPPPASADVATAAVSPAPAAALPPSADPAPRLLALPASEVAAASAPALGEPNAVAGEQPLSPPASGVEAPATSPASERAAAAPPAAEPGAVETEAEAEPAPSDRSETTTHDAEVHD